MPRSQSPVKAAMNKTLKASYNTVPADITTTTTSNADLVSQHGIVKALDLVRSMSDSDINVDQLEGLIKENVSQLRSANARVKTAIGQAAARLDRLRYGPGAKKLTATPTGTATKANKSAATKTVSKVAEVAAMPGVATKTAASHIDPAVVRKWASDQGLAVASRGRIPQAVIQAYERRPGKPSSAATQGGGSGVAVVEAEGPGEKLPSDMVER